jgi:uncharacterized protein
MIQAQWRNWANKGLEGVVLVEQDDGVRADSVVVGYADGKQFKARYSIVCDPQWRTRSVSVSVNDDESHLVITSDGASHWSDSNGEQLPALDGAIDVDITATPFTNTLPIRRLGLEAGQSADILTAYIDVPSLTITADPQRYTCLEPMRRYRFESQGGDFVREIEVDEHGMVVLYPGLFRRVL